MDTISSAIGVWNTASTYEEIDKLGKLPENMSKTTKNLDTIKKNLTNIIPN